jgi:hypothetical protein
MSGVTLSREQHNKSFGLGDTSLEKADGQPPGPPPRPGLQWKPETSRWIRPESPHEEKLALYVKQQRLRERIPNLQGVAPANTTALVKYLTEQIPENASKFYGMLDWLEQYAKLALQGTDTSNEFVDDLYKKTNKAYKKIWKPSVLRSFFDEADKHPSRLNKVIAIDAFAHTAHDRGSILPHVFMETLERPKDAQAVGFNYEWSVLSNMDDVVGGIFDEIYMRENISPETKSARESLFNYIQQTKNHSYGRDDLNAWVNKGEFEDVGVELLTETSGIDKVYARKASDLMPDPYSIGFYDWVEKTLDLGGSQIKGVKETGRQIEADLYSSLKKACNKYLDSVTPDMMQHEIINGLSSVVEKWTRDQSISMSEAFDKLYKAGLYAGALDAGVKRASNLADELVLRLLKTDPNRLGARIKLFSKDVIERFNKIISNAYTAEGEFWLPGMMKEMMEVVPAQRYQIERIVRTEVASISNAGRLYGWSQDPLKYYNDYMWNATYDNRAKFISLWRANQNPLTYDEAKFLWENQAQMFNGRVQNDVFNQRCSLTRRPIEFERKGNRWDGDGSFIMTLSLGF